MTDKLINQTLMERYSVHEYIGRGGMAEVYKVWDRQRAVFLAMKLLLDDFAEDVVFLRRFRREAQALATLQHPHIVRFYGLEQDGPLAFILMDYVHGKSLRREIFTSVQGIAYNRVLGIMRPVCSALHYAHNKGMIHCDVKPSNILIDHKGDILVTDFGISRMSDSATATLVGMGTPAYMAPEQVRGLDPTPQTDIYALGIILYEMLTGGERPFTGEKARTTGGTGEKIRWEQLHLEPRSPRDYNPAIPKELESVIEKCLSKMSQNRYQNSLDLLNAIEFGLTGLVEETFMEGQGGSLSPIRPLVIPEAGRSSYTDSRRGPQPIPVQRDKRVNWNWGSILGVIGVLSLLFAIVLFLTNQGYRLMRPTEEPVSILQVTDTPVPPTPTEALVVTDAINSVETNTAAPSPTDTLEPTPTATESPTPTVEIADLQICADITVEDGLEPTDRVCIFAIGSSPQFVTIRFPSPPPYMIYLWIDWDRFDCYIPERTPEMFYCSGPEKPTSFKLPVRVHRVVDGQVLAEGEVTFFQPTPTPTLVKETAECNTEGCEDNLIPSETPEP
jgi:serine/threonine protein kinase